MRHLSTRGTIMAAIKESHTNVGHYVALKADSPKPSAPPEPTRDLEINPYSVELPYPKTDPSRVQQPCPDKNPCVVGSLGTGFPYHKQALVCLPGQNGDAVVQQWQECQKAVMKEGDAPNRCPAYRELDCGPPAAQGPSMPSGATTPAAPALLHAHWWWLCRVCNGWQLEPHNS